MKIESAKDVVKFASSLTSAELSDAEELCRDQLHAWVEAFDAVQYYLRQYELGIKGDWRNKE